MLGLVNTWLIELPEEALAPVIPPVTVPIVHVNVLGVVAVKERFGLVPLHAYVEDAFVTAGLGFTVTVMV